MGGVRSIDFVLTCFNTLLVWLVITDQKFYTMKFFLNKSCKNSKSIDSKIYPKKKVVVSSNSGHVLPQLNMHFRLNFQVDMLIRELCGVHNIKIPNEVTILMHGESSSGSAKPVENSVVKSNEDKNEVQNEDPNEDGYDSDTSISSLDSDVFDTTTRFEMKSPSKRSSDDAAPLEKAHWDVFKKIVSVKITSS